MRFLHRLRSAFDVPTGLATIGTLTVSVGIAVWTRDAGLGLVVFGTLCLLGALYSAPRPRR